jgi:ketosteroid isomerase-like protein
MSRRNLELARRAYEAFNRRNEEEFLALMDDEVEAESRLVAMEGGYHGHEGIRRWWNDFLGVFPDYAIELEELRDLGDVTLARFQARAAGASSGAPLFDPVWQPIRWRNGKCVWWKVCLTEAEALEAAGLGE